MPRLRRPSRICGTAAAASSRSTVIRTSSEPARDSAAICATVPSTSAVSVLVIDCTTIGAPPPTATLPTITCVVVCRGRGPATSEVSTVSGLFMRSRISGFGHLHQGGGSADDLCAARGTLRPQITILIVDSVTYVTDSACAKAFREAYIVALTARLKGSRLPNGGPKALASEPIISGEQNMAERGGLISTQELADIIGERDLRVFDCTSYLDYQPEGSGVPYIVVPGKRTFEEGHIPSADFLDLQGEFSDQTTELRFMMPAIAQLEAAFGRHGLGNDSRVVLYSIGTAMWATRFWWMLQSLGFENVSVLDGGLDTWKAGSRAIETGPAKGYPPATFTAKPQRGYFVDKHQVLAACGERNTVVVNALSPQFHKGLQPSRYGRPGRIPGSVNVFAATLFDPETKAFIPLAEAEAKFAAQGISKDKRVVAYCGGGISATIGLFQLHRLGYNNLTLYDGSMGEWAKDASLPIETG